MFRNWTDPLATRVSRLRTFFLLYVSEGIPLGFTAGVIAVHMRRHGVDPAAIGAYVGSLYLPWAFKWAVGPIVDTVTSTRFGRRRTWIVGAQIGMMLFLLAALPIDFETSIALFTAVIALHNICAATQDVAIDALAVYGDTFKVECPTGSGQWMNLYEVADELSRRLTRIFLRDEANGDRRPVYGGTEKFQTDPYWRDHLLFYEYFHGDNGAGLGASHQTGWTGLVARLIQLHGLLDPQRYLGGDKAAGFEPKQTQPKKRGK